MPYNGARSEGLGKPLKIMTHPLRADIPIFIGAEGPKNVAQTAEIADGWLPLYYSPYRQEVYADSLDARQARLRDHALVTVNVTDDVETGLWPVKADARVLHRRHGRQGRRTSTPS